MKKLVLDLVDDHKRQLQKSNVSTQLLYEFKIKEEIPTRQNDFSSDIFINADKIRINQVLDNLLTNAIKFTKEGIVSIPITKRKKDENHIDRIIISVKDTGTGIHPEILPSLFSKLIQEAIYVRAWGCSFQKILWKLMVGRYGERITLMEKELHSVERK